jgi:hypothetical protein
MPPRAKDAMLVVLVLVNVVMLCAVLGQVFQLPRANAQAIEVPAAQRFLAVSGQVQPGFDVMYVIDTLQQRLYAWIPNRGSSPASMILRDMRDLRLDFSKQPTPVVPPRPR